MSGTALFFRLLSDQDRGERLADAIGDLRTSKQEPEIYSIASSSFQRVPGNPFAYWAPRDLLEAFDQLPMFEGEGRTAKQGLATANDTRFLRLWWEPLPETIFHTYSPTLSDRSKTNQDLTPRWVPFAKGGSYSPFFADMHLVVYWDGNGSIYWEDINQSSGKPRSNIWQLTTTIPKFFLRPGLTWSRRSQRGFSARAMPVNCIFADKGPVIFVQDDNPKALFGLLAVTNSATFRELLSLQMAFGSFEVGVIQRTPVPSLELADLDELSQLAVRAYALSLSNALDDETNNIFSTPLLLRHWKENLASSLNAIYDYRAKINSELQHTQAAIDDLTQQLYSLSHDDMVTESIQSTIISGDDLSDPDEDDSPSSSTSVEVDNALSWMVGAVLGRWDARIALDQNLAPEASGAFQPLPVCSPGRLVAPDGLPAEGGRIVSEEWLRKRPDVLSLPPAGSVAHPTIADDAYPLRIDWDGILVDDEGHPDDIVTHVRDVLNLLWRERAEMIEEEACQTLGIRNLRQYFRDPKRFWDFHVKRYSKSRRKAPIYWLLQSGKRSYAIWLYYHRLDSDTLFKAIRYVTDRLQLEQSRLGEALAAVTAVEHDPKARRTLEKQIEAHESFITEVSAFRAEVQRVADLGLVVDHDDGVLLSIAPLYNLVPWAPAKTAWNELVAGKYDWSSMSQQMRAKGLIKGGARG